MKKTWDTIKEVIGNTKIFKNDILKRMVINGTETFDRNKMANGYNQTFLKSGLNLHLQTQPLPKISDRCFSSKDFRNSVTGIYFSRERISGSF